MKWQDPKRAPQSLPSGVPALVEAHSLSVGGIYQLVSNQEHSKADRVCVVIAKLMSVWLGKTAAGFEKANCCDEDMKRTSSLL